MGGLLCNGARRLAILVAGALLLVSVPFVIDGRVRTLPAACAAMALGLLLGALTPLGQSLRLLRLAEQLGPAPSASTAYRASTREADTEPTEKLAIRQAAMALLLLSMAGALTVVAAVAR